MSSLPQLIRSNGQLHGDRIATRFQGRERTWRGVQDRVARLAAALRSLWSDGPSKFEGKHYRWPEVESNPKPVQRPGIPIVVGGHVKGAARRAARIGDGLLPMGGDKLPELLEEMRKECERIDRDPGEIELTTGGTPTPDEVKRLEDQGISRFVLSPPGFDREALAVCGLDVKRLEREGVEPGEAMSRLTRWVHQQNDSGGQPVFVGHNAVFDWAYIAYYYAHFKMKNPFGYKGIDAKSLAMGRLGIGWNETSKERLQQLLGLPALEPAEQRELVAPVVSAFLEAYLASDATSREAACRYVYDVYPQTAGVSLEGAPRGG